MNIYDYLVWRGDVPFSLAPFNPVDNLILSRLSYTRFNEIVSVAPVPLGEATQAVRQQGNTDATMILTGESQRFSACQICLYAEETDSDAEKQFAAMTVLSPDGAVNICYRGTDNTLVGWREDFNLAFATPVPAQRAAVSYLNRAAALHDGPIRVMGHSKGGNLAVYAAAFAEDEVQRRIETVYNDDGPGHDSETLRSAGYMAVRDRIHTYIPQSSIVGLLLEQAENYEIIQSSAVSVLQHDPMSWLVTPTGFIPAQGISPGSLYLSDTVRLWLAQLSSDERRAFTNALFDVLEASGAKTLDGIKQNWRSAVPSMIRELRKIDIQSAAMLLEISNAFIRAALRVKEADKPKLNP